MSATDAGPPGDDSSAHADSPVDDSSAYGAPPVAAEVFDLLCLLVSSSRGAIEEGVFTASLRLIHAAERLAAIGARLPASDEQRRAFFERVSAELGSGSTGSYLSGPDAYLAFLDDAVRSVATEIRRDNGL